MEKNCNKWIFKTVSFLIKINSKVINYNYDIYEKNTIVKYHGSYFIAVDDKNASEPNDYLVSILHVRIICKLRICLEIRRFFLSMFLKCNLF